MPRRPAAAEDVPPATPDDGPSRSRKKREAQACVALADALIALPPPEFDALDLDEKLRDAVELARGITAHGGRARQRQYVAKLLRKRDVESVRAALAARAAVGREASRDFHRLEAWRDRLVAEGEPALESLLAGAPALDAARLRQLVAAARAERAAGRAPAAARELFRVLRDALAAPKPSGR